MPEKQDHKQVIVLIDDDHDFLYQHRIALEQAGYVVITADNRKAAEDAVAANRPDLVVMDLMMEEQDSGFAMCYHFKKLYPDLPVIMVSAVTSETGLSFNAATDEEKNWIKADSFLAKPIRLEQLIAEVKHYLGEAGDTHK
jgi:CheY-like chemotaxis protein